MNRRQFLIAGVAVIALPVLGCASNNPANPGPDQTLLQLLVAAPNAVAVLAQVGAGLEATCVIKPGSGIQGTANGLFTEIAALLDAASVAVAAGDAATAQAKYDAAAASIRTLSADLDSLNVPPAAQQRMMAMVPSLGAKSQGAAGLSAVDWVQLAPVVINLIIGLIPVGQQLVGVVQSWINQLRGGNATVYTAADVKQAVDHMHTSIAVWTQSATMVCS